MAPVDELRGWGRCVADAMHVDPCFVLGAGLIGSFVGLTGGGALLTSMVILPAQMGGG